MVFSSIKYYRLVTYDRRFIQPISILPFNQHDLFRAGNSDEWPRLRKIVRLLANDSFAVTNPETQLMLDKTRKLFDESVDDHGQNCFLHLLDSSSDKPRRLELLLSLGVDPDRPDDCGFRPSHLCASQGLVKSAHVVFMCRPDMAARDGNGHTPLEAAHAKYQVCFVPAGFLNNFRSYLSKL